MPNNSSARRGKKKKDKTDFKPSRKEHKAIKEDSISLPLSVAGEDDVSLDRSSLFFAPGRMEIAADPSDPKYFGAHSPCGTC